MTDHLARAKEYIAIAESGDAKIEAYKSAAEEIRAAMDDDPTIGVRAVASALGRSKSWVDRLVRWSTSVQDPQHPPFGGEAENQARYERADRRKVEEVIRERPEAIAEAIAKAPAEAQRRIADEIVKQPTEGSLKRLATPREPRKPKSAHDSLSEAAVKVGDVAFSLWTVSDLLMDEAPSGEDRIRLLSLLDNVEAGADRATRMARGLRRLLETGELEDELQRLIEEVRS